ncbi:hypothetical protein [Litorimonas sp. WD9-15]|uniref:hypothetical protein n=1 Tax=Litorimonas sp. WD9-15 TaxID=3418716 RepID=UPI003D0635FB
MNSQSFTEPRQLGAVLKYDSEGNFTRENRTFTNGGAAVVVLQPGNIMTGGVAPALFDTANPAAFTGVNLTYSEVQPGASVKIATVEGGPVILNAAEIDFPADASQTATLKTAMAAVNIKLVDGLPS